MNNKRPSIIEENGDLYEKKKFANPLHLQRIEASLEMAPFMAYAHHILSRPIISEGDSDDSDNAKEINQGDKIIGGFKVSKHERRTDKLQVFNFSQIDDERKWLQDVLLSDTDSESEISDEDDYMKEMLKQHVMEQKFREKYYKKPSNSQYAYYGAGLLSNYDQFPDHQRSIVGPRKRRRKEREKKVKEHKNKSHKEKNVVKPNQTEPGEIDPNDIPDLEWEDSSLQIKDDGMEDDETQGGTGSGRGRKKKSLKMTPELMAVRRRRAWQTMAKKELGKVQRAKVNNHKEMLQSCKRVASMCMKMTRQKAMASQKLMKDLVWRAKRLTREMQGYWKRYDRVERENRRRMEKEAEEQRKLDVEIIEAKRQQRKLNFLITQTELYAHFMSKKLGYGTEEEQIRILQQLDEELNPRLAAIDDYDSDLMKLKAQQNAEDAFSAERARTQQFDVDAEENHVSPTIGDDGNAELPQPELFKGTLKIYQIKGMTWLANLYDQGISGILADEMGLGKTVQSIALLCHIAERYGVWGPFLIISPASTLHNWQQEMQRFVPSFNVVPYWGNPNERKILRQFWEQKDLHTKDASFHVVITSYQLVVSDYKYFNRIKWQYMVLDEAQAIKSSSSQRWKLLLQFNCRNRLLLSGTPIQNSMAELWALLHFIMPTLFDSHDEFNEWFSKDIESHAENKTGIDEKQISRLHMILKPFMLRRIKKDVENELSDKIEIMVYCPLTTRQKLLYMALKKKIKIEDLLHCVGAEGHHVDKNFTSNLMNLVMQFRKVCNHPELFERRDAKSPFSMKCQEYVIPKLVYDDGILFISMPSKKHLLYNRFNIFKSENVHRSIFEKFPTDKNVNYKKYVDLNLSSPFSWSRFTNESPQEIENSTLNGLFFKYDEISSFNEILPMLSFRYNWCNSLGSSKFFLLEPMFMKLLDRRYLGSSILHNFLFTNMTINESMVYTFGNYTVRNMQETIEHRVIRSRNRNREHESKSSLIEALDPSIKVEIKLEEDEKPFITNSDEIRGLQSPNKVGRPPKYAEKSPKSPGATTLLPEFPYIPRQPKKHECEPISLPKFVCNVGPKVQAYGRRPYVVSRSAETNYSRHITCEDFIGKDLVDSILAECKPDFGWSWITIPDKQTLISDAGKLSVLDSLLTRLKSQGHRVLIYSQMTKMIDLLEEYMWHRKYRYMRLDGSSKISARRDMVADFQSRADIFVFLLSTRAGGLGINLTAADTVIFYDSDWNPTVDQQAMDRAHRLGQTKQVTVYRLICKGTIEERILQRAREKSEIQRMVISGGNFKPDTLKPKEVVSLLLDDEEIELKYRQKTEEKKTIEEKSGKDTDKKRKISKPIESTGKKIKIEGSGNDDESIDVGVDSPALSEKSQNGSNGGGSGNGGTPSGNETLVPGATSFLGGLHDESSNEGLIVDCDSPLRGNTPVKTKPNITNHLIHSFPYKIMEEEPVETIDVEDLKRIEREERNKRILEWITKHSQPKVLVMPKIVRHPTRFQKSGPMTAENWSNWRKWVRRNGIAKSKRKEKKKPPPPSPEKGDEEQEGKPKRVNINRMNEMAMPKKVKTREKYEPPPPEIFTFMPKIIDFDPDKQKPRKIPLNYNPYEISKGALTYRATQTIIRLAKPRKPTGPSYLISRKKFTNKQWKIYQKYLQIFSFPKLRIPIMMGDCIDPSSKSKSSSKSKQIPEENKPLDMEPEPKKFKWWQCCNRNKKTQQREKEDYCSLLDSDSDADAKDSKKLRKRKRGPNKKYIARLALPKKCPALFDEMRCLKPKIKDYLHKDGGKLYKQELINNKRLEARAERIKYHLLPEIYEDKKYKAKLEKLGKYKKKESRDDADDEDEEKKNKKSGMKTREKARAQPKKCPKEFDKNLCLKPKQKDYLKKGTNIRALTLAELLEIKAKREAKEKKGSRPKKIDVFYPEKRIPKSLKREPPTGTPAIERRKECILNVKHQYLKYKNGPQYKISKPIRMRPDMEKIKRKNLAAWEAEKNPKFYDENGKERPPTAAERKKITQALMAKPKRCVSPIDIDGLGCIPPTRKDFLKKGQYTKRSPPATSASSIETLGETESQVEKSPKKKIEKKKKPKNENTIYLRR